MKIKILKVLFFLSTVFPCYVYSQFSQEEAEVIINIVSDNFPEDISWSLFTQNTLIGSGLINNDTICVDKTDCITFEIIDSFGDGLCCQHGSGFYEIYFAGELIANGSEFQSKVIHHYCDVKLEDIVTAIDKMITHVNNTNPIGPEEREFLFSQINYGLEDYFIQIKTKVFQFTETYETHYPILFENRFPVEFNDLLPETRLMIVLQQYILDKEFTPDNILNMEGVSFKFAEVFPGKVDLNAPRVDNATVSINGTHIHRPAAITAFDQDPAKRPTGYYAPPGELVTITIPEELVDANLHVQIGAHDDDLSSKGVVNRLVRITKEFPLNQKDNVIANPLGGGIYIKIPEPSDIGWFDIIINEAVKSPYFSLITDHESSVSSWQADLASHEVEWVDLEADKFMMTLPLSHVMDLDDPSSLLMQWNDIMNGYNFLGGRPVDHRSKAEYFAVDCILPGGAYGIGYPQVIGDNRAPYGPLINTDLYPTQVLKPNPHLSRLHITFHEYGHAAAHPKLPTERETLVNIYAPYVYNELYNIPLEEAFKHSEFQLLKLDGAAIDWMITHNFRNNIDMSCDPIALPGPCDELRYQHRGHAKYIEMANNLDGLLYMK